MSDATKEFMHQQFKAYYDKRPDFFVPSAEAREFALEPFNGDFQRYHSYNSIEHLQDSMQATVPKHLYHSVAHYTDFQGITNMEILADHFLKADFLVDVDCKPGKPPLGDGYRNLNEALNAAKDYVRRCAEILSEELGVPEDVLNLSFSGSKGYHLDSQDADLQQLSKVARREIGALMTGVGSQFKDLWPGKGKKIIVPDQMPSGGLPRRLFQGLEKLMMHSRNPQNPIINEALRRVYGPDEDHAEPLQYVLQDIGSHETSTHMLNDDDMSKRHDLIMKFVQELSCPKLDLQPIQNIRGLKRVPGSLNGKTGLMCMKLDNLDALYDFDPIRDASPFSRHRNITIKASFDRGQARSLNTDGDTFTLQRDEVAEVPLNVGMVFLGNGLAEVPS